MKNIDSLKFLFCFMLFISINAMAQNDTTYDDSSYTDVSDIQPKHQQHQPEKKWHFGLYIGSLIPNQASAYLYDGTGFDGSGNRNSWTNSWMNQKINYQNGYGTSPNYDRISSALNVNPQSWSFNQGNMPTNMHYTPGFNIGLNTRYSVDKKNAILINLNASLLFVSGVFTINVQPLSHTPDSLGYVNCTIVGKEERLVAMFGYQHLFGDIESNFQFLVEGGLSATATEFVQNAIVINNLNIDLTSYNNSAAFNQSPSKRPIGIGAGVFGGVGINIKTDGKYSAQIVYNPSFETINIGPGFPFLLQNAIGLRFYYNLL